MGSDNTYYFLCFFSILHSNQSNNKHLEDCYYMFEIHYEKQNKRIEKTRGLTLQELAELVNSSNQQISQLETGRRRLNVDWLERLSKGLECHPMELLYDNVMAKTEQEEAMLELFRGLSPEQREAFFKSDYCAGATSKNDG